MLNYNYIANQAVLLERAEQYKQACLVWRKAIGFARNELNRHWAEIRGDYCKAWGDKLNV